MWFGSVFGRGYQEGREKNSGFACIEWDKWFSFSGFELVQDLQVFLVTLVKILNS